MDKINSVEVKLRLTLYCIDIRWKKVRWCAMGKR